MHLVAGTSASVGPIMPVSVTVQLVSVHFPFNTITVLASVILEIHI
jgi:hypothetical protein